MCTMRRIDKFQLHGGSTSLLTQHPSGCCHVFCRSVIEIGPESISAKMRISARRSRLAWWSKCPPYRSQNSFRIPQKVCLPQRALALRPARSTRRGHITLEGACCHGTCFRIRGRMASWPRCHVITFCVSAAAPRWQSFPAPSTMSRCSRC